MAEITPNYGLPYPEASDPVNVAGDIEALAKAIDDDLGELIQDTIGGMVSSNTENGISVTYNDELGKLNFDVTVIPTQSGNTGKYLTTDGTAVSWGTVDALPDQTGNTGKYLTTDGTDASWATVDVGDVSYLDLTDVPSTFAPSAHATSHGSGGSDAITIAQSQVTNLTTDLAGKASSTHTHSQSDITNLTTDLAAKANTTGAVLINTTLQSPIEKIGLLTINSGNVNLNLAQASVWINTVSSNGTFAINIQGPGGNLISALEAGESITASYINEVANTASYPTGIQVDGSNVGQVFWQDGPPVSSQAGGKNIYTINITKPYSNVTNTSGLIVLGSSSRFSS